MDTRQLACAALLVAGLAAGCASSETAADHTAVRAGSLAEEKAFHGAGAIDSAYLSRRDIAQTMPHTMCRSLDTADPQTAPEHIMWLPPNGHDLAVVRNQALEDNESLRQTLRSVDPQTAPTAAALLTAPNFEYGTPNTFVSDTGDLWIAIEQVQPPCTSIVPEEVGPMGIGECLFATINRQGAVTVDRRARSITETPRQDGDSAAQLSCNEPPF